MKTAELVNKIVNELGTEFHGRLPAKKQRELFGLFLGKGQLHIDIESGVIDHCVSVCFGQDWDVTGGIRIHESGLSHEIWSNR